VGQVGAAHHHGALALQRGGNLARDVAVAADTAPHVVGAPDLDGAQPPGVVRGLGVGPHPGAEAALVIGRGVGQVLGERDVDRAVRVERARDRVDGAGALRGRQERRGERGPDALPLRVVAGVGAVVEVVGAVGGAGERVDVRGVQGEVLDAVDPRAAARTARDGDAGAALGQQGSDVGADGACSDDEVAVSHDHCSILRAVLSLVP
jgi:hypothetical protein